VLEKAKQMEDEGHKIIKLNIGNLAVFNFDPPDEIVQDMIRNMHLLRAIGFQGHVCSAKIHHALHAGKIYRGVTIEIFISAMAHLS
jgi:alanine-synthesizing transaminase